MVPPLLGWPVEQKNPPVTAEENRQASLTRYGYGPGEPVAIPSAMITVAAPARTTSYVWLQTRLLTHAFGGRLPGPFTSCAGIGFPPPPDSLDPASAATIPDLCRC